MIYVMTVGALALIVASVIAVGMIPRIRAFRVTDWIRSAG